ncbi:MAG: solute carrier family 23 protein, partial [Halolamina sp.]
MGLTETLAEYFEVEAHGSDVRTELLAGLTTFLTMSYIVVVNPAILSAAISVEGVGTARLKAMLAVVTIISAATATLVMALYANRPFAQAPGLGLNAFFAFTVVLTLGVPWQTALAAVVVEGLLFIGLTAVGAREYVIKLFPEPVKLAVGSGIGLFLAIIGFQAMRVVAGDPVTFVTFSPVFAKDPVALLSVAGLFLTFGLYARGVKGSVIIGILTTTALGYVAAALGYTAFPAEDAGANIVASTLTGSTTTYSLAAYDITPLAGAFIDGFANVDAFTFSL